MKAGSSSDFDYKLRTLVIYEALTVQQLTAFFGLSERAIRNHLKRLGLQASNEQPQTPYGLTNNSYDLRSKLGTLLTDMTSSGLKQQEISRITGLNRNENYRAQRRPYGHDWKLSQIERLLSYHGKTLKDIV